MDELQHVGIPLETAEFLYDQMAIYYFEPLTPRPEDRVDSTMRIDPEDIGDLAELYCETFSIPLPSVKAPCTLPQDPSLKELGLWLENYRLSHQH